MPSRTASAAHPITPPLRGSRRGKGEARRRGGGGMLPAAAARRSVPRPESIPFWTEGILPSSASPGRGVRQSPRPPADQRPRTPRPRSIPSPLRGGRDRERGMGFQFFRSSSFKVSRLRREDIRGRDALGPVNALGPINALGPRECPAFSTPPAVDPLPPPWGRDRERGMGFQLFRSSSFSR